MSEVKPTLSREDIVRLCERVEGAQRRACAIPKLTDEYPAMSIADGYAVQSELRRRLIATAGITHSEGLACYPDASVLARLSEPALHAAGFSRSKSQTLLALARLVADGLLPLDTWRDGTPVDEIRARLLAVRGIGPWTINYTLLRGFAHLDGSLHGDAAVRRKLQPLLGRTERLTAEETETWLANFSPWRALVAAHLWASA